MAVRQLIVDWNRGLRDAANSPTRPLLQAAAVDHGAHHGCVTGSAVSSMDGAVRSVVRRAGDGLDEGGSQRAVLLRYTLRGGAPSPLRPVSPARARPPCRADLGHRGGRNGGRRDGGQVELEPME